MPSASSQGSYRNYQLLTSGLINAGTSMIVDTNYDPSYTLFRLQLTAFALGGSGFISLNFDNDSTAGHYSNITSASTSAAILSDDTGGMNITDEFNGEYSIWWPNIPTPPSSAVYLSGYSTYRSGGAWFRYQVFCRAFPPNRGGGHPSPFLALSGSGGLNFNSGFYLMTGANGAGAALLSTSTQGG